MHSTVILALSFLAVSSCWAAEPYPSKPVRVVVPFGPGGGIDIVGRAVAEQMARQTGKPFLIENRPAGGGIVGMTYVAKAPGDGYTLLVSGLSVATLPGMSRSLPFDVSRDFTPITQLMASPNVLVVKTGGGFQNVKELVERARAAPGQLLYGSSGDAALNRLAPELWKRTAGIDIQNVPYKGSGDTLTAVMSEQVHLVIAPVVAVLAPVRSGKLKALAVTDVRRSPALPDVPTMTEAGIVGMEVPFWTGLLGPGGLPRDITLFIQGEAARALTVPVVKEALQAQGAELVGSTPEQFATLLQSEVRRWSEVIKSAGIQPQ